MSNLKHWLVTGASGLLGHALVAALRADGATVTAVRATHPVGIAGARDVAADVTDKAAITRIIEDSRANVVVHAAGLTNVDECERNPRAAQLLHVDATGFVAEAARRVGAKLVYISTDHLWDGTRALVTEETPPYPINVYARTKLDGETLALRTEARTLAVRTNFFGPGRPWRKSFSDWILDRLQDGSTLNMFSDAYFTPISLDHLSRFLIELVAADVTGALNVAGSERLSKFDFAVALAQAFGLPHDMVRRTSIGSFGLAAPRPRDMSLDTSRAAAILGHPLPRVAEGIATLKAGALTAARNG